MIKIILSSFLVTALYTPFGIFFHKGKNFTSLSTQLIFSLILISFFSLFFNFFFALNQNFNSIFLLVGLFLLIRHRKIYLSINFFIFCLLSSLLVFLLITNSHLYRPDAGLYHLSYINILNYEKIIIGISNLHFRFGHISIVQYLSAISNNLIFGENGIVFPVALIGVSVIVNFLSHLYLKFKDDQIDFHFLFIFSIIIFIFYKMNRYSEYGNDAPAHFLIFFLISEIIKNYKIMRMNDLSNYFLIAIFIVMNKVILIVSILFPLVFFLKKKIKFELVNKKNLFILFFIFLWCIKNILVSGCLLYPLKETCLKNLSWINLEMTEKVSIENEAWAKGWPDFRKEEMKVNQKEYIKKFYWLKTWSNNHFLKILKILLPYLLLLALILVFLKKEKMHVEKEKFIKVLSFLSLVGVIIWFLKVPAFRYGYSYIIIFISLIFASLTYKFIFNKKNKIVLGLSITILLMVFSIKNLNRIIFDEKNYFNYPWPKFYSYEKTNNKKQNKFKIIDGEKIYIPNGRYCMFGNAPCGPNDNLNIRKENNYLIFVPSF